MDAPNTTPPSMIERQLKPTDVGAQGFLKWLKISMPAVYRDILPDLKRLQAEAKAASLSGVGAFGESGVSIDVPAGTANASSTWTDQIKNLVQAWGQYKLTSEQLKTASKITDANLERARLGLPPLPYDAGQLGLAPTVNVGLTGSTASLVKYGAIGVGLFLLANMLTGRRSRA